MKKFMRMALIMGSLVSLTGCTMTPYGNYAAVSNEHNQKLAKATLIQLVKLYSPARTRFNLCQLVTDSYGALLIQGMRDKGYAVLEYSLQRKNRTTNLATSGFDFRYTVDTVDSTNLYRVTLFIGSKSISRAFTFATDGKLHPIGSWAYKE